MKKINNNLPRGGAEWGRALRRFLSDNIVPIMFVLICAYCIPRADLSWNYLLNEGMTRLGRNAFLILRQLTQVRTVSYQYQCISGQFLQGID